METAWTEQSLTEKIITRHNEEYVKLRQPYDDKFQTIVNFCDPGLTAWDTDTDSAEGEFRGENIYEGTAPWALRTMTDGWLGNLISMSDPWFHYTFPDKKLRDNDEVNAWMQQREDQMYYTYRQSEFYSAMSPFTRFAFSVGSPVIIPYEDRDSGRIKCLVPSPKENYHGPRDGYHRYYDITVAEAVSKFLKNKIPDDIDDAILSRAILEDYYNGHHSKRYKFIMAIYRKDDPILHGQPKRFRNEAWMEFYVEAAAAHPQIKKPPIQVKGHATKPHIRWDYERNSDENYARTPSWHAISDITSEQALSKQELMLGERSLHPPMWAMNKYILNLDPGGVVRYTSPNDFKNKPEPIFDGSNYSVGTESLDRRTAAVKKWFKTDLFRLLSQLAQQKGGWPTATQVLQMSGEEAAMLAPHMGRFATVLREIDNRFMDIEQRRGTLERPPDIILEYMALRKSLGDKSLELGIELLGPLTQVQQISQTLSRSQAGREIIGEYMQLDPLLVHKAKLSIAMEKDLEGVRWPADAMNSEDEYQTILATLAEQEAAQQAMEQAGAVADAVPKLSKEVEEGSPLALVGAA